MSNRLIMATLTICMLFVLSGSAFGTGEHSGDADRETIQLRTPNPPYSIDDKQLRQKPARQPDVARPIDESLISDQFTGTTFPPPYMCEPLSYGGVDIGSAFGIGPSGYTHYSMRMTPAAGYACTLKTAFIQMYVPNPFGEPDMEVSIWDDDGIGYPGTELAVVLVPFAAWSLTSDGEYYAVDFESFELVFTDGEEFHVAVTNPDLSGATMLAIYGDDGTFGENRSGLFVPGEGGDPGTFYHRTDVGWDDNNFHFTADVCCADLPYSNCETMSWDCGYAYSWWYPNSYGEMYYNTRFTANGYDTLTSVEIGFESPWPGDGTPDADIFVWGSAAGFPDWSEVIYSTTILFADLVWIDEGNMNVVDLTSEDIIVHGDFHVGSYINPVSEAAGYYLNIALDTYECGTGHSSAFVDGDGWYPAAALWAAEPNNIISASLCRDEFNVCARFSDHCPIEWYLFSLPHSAGNGRVGIFEAIEPFGIGCRLEMVRIMTDDLEREGYYSYNSMVQIWSDLGGAPDPNGLLAEIEIGPNAGAVQGYVNWPGYNEVDVSAFNIQFDDQVWVGIHTFKQDDGSGPDYFVVGDEWDDVNCTGDIVYGINSDSTWSHSYLNLNMFIEADICCIPPAERTCTPGEDWPTAGHDFRRTGASENSTGDARCQQAVSWMNPDDDGLVYSRPIISDGVVMAGYNSKLQGFDISNGDLLYSKFGFPQWGNLQRNSVTVQDGVVYAGGGSARSFNAFDLHTGVDIWSRNATGGVGMGWFDGSTIYTTSVILGEVIYLGTEAGEFAALNIADGTLFGDWDVNPILLNGDVKVTTSSNGSDVLYVGTDGLLGGGGNGTLYAIDAATGEINWTMTNDGTGNGLLGYELDGDTTSSVTTEFFQGPISCEVAENGTFLYFLTHFEAEVDGAPSAGYYKVEDKGTSGSVVWAINGKYGRFTGPVQDGAHVIFQSLRAWTSENVQIQAFTKGSGSKKWDSDPLYNGISWVEGALSCEVLTDDLYYTGNHSAQFLVVNSETGLIDFQYDYIVVGSGSARFSGAAIDASHVVMSNRQGDLYCFTNQADRPRLKINTYDTLVPIPFFTLDDTPVYYPEVFFNNGCANLSFTLSADVAPPEISGQSVDPNRLERMRAQANSMTNNSYPEMARTLVKAQRVDSDIFDADFTESAYSKDSYSNMAAYGAPDWLNFIVVTSGDLAEGQPFDIEYNINGELVFRGAQRCYITIASNDDFYINDLQASPVVQLGVLGGCLQTEDVLVFGSSEQNTAPVHNTGEMGNQNTDNFWEFEGDHAAYWQGTLVFMQSPTGGNDFTAPFRMAWTSDDWGGNSDYWNSLLPDPICGSCDPTMSDGPILLGQMSHNGGETYTDVFGYGAVYRYIDSVINFDCDGLGWDWDNVTCSFDNSITMGISVDERMYGVIGVPALSNVVIFKMDIANRNHPAAIDDTYMASLTDFDMESGGNDVFKFDQATSVGYGSSCGGAGVDVGDTKVYGIGKIPMDVDPMIGVRSLDANQAMWHSANIALDSMYYWITQEPGQTAQKGLQMEWPCDPSQSVSDDREVMHNFTKLNFDSDGLYTMGIYLFGFANADVNDDSRYTDLAILVNQFCGFSRGDINGDGAINLADVVALSNMVSGTGNGPLFKHLADVNNDKSVDGADVIYLATYYFDCTCTAPAPVGAWVLPNICE